MSTNFDENFFAKLEKEEVATEESYVGQYEELRDAKEEREADRMNEYFEREPSVY